LSDEYLLLIIGSGDVIHQLKANALKFNLKDKIKFIDKIPATELRHYTINADLGVTIDKDTNMNYHFSLPNKVFDYLHAGIPILATRLPEIENIVKTYQVGTFIENHDPKHIAERIHEFLSSAKYLNSKANTKLAASENNWKTERRKLEQLINEAS